MKPFFTKVFEDGIVRIAFAYQYLAIERDGEVFQFVPVQAKDVYYDYKKKAIRNKSDAFVFQNGNKTIKLSLRQFETLADVRRIIHSIAMDALGDTISRVKPEELDSLMDEIVEMNIKRAIDIALSNNDEKLFNELIAMSKSFDKSIKL